jgi:hypothetical protein
MDGFDMVFFDPKIHIALTWTVYRPKTKTKAAINTIKIRWQRVFKSEAAAWSALSGCTWYMDAKTAKSKRARFIELGYEVRPISWCFKNKVAK